MAKFICIKKCYKSRVYEVGDELELHNGTKTPAHFKKAPSKRKAVQPKNEEPEEPKTLHEISEKSQGR